ncbi:MAG: DUF1501 domain-containing protein [Bryobacteraceae bacterium]
MKSPLFVSRREFMQKSGRLVSTIGAAAAFAPFGSINARAQAGPDYKAMVCIFLFGGNDANNTVVPLGPQYAAYQSIRQGLAIPSASLLAIGNSRNETYGLHPSMTTLHPLYTQKKVAVVANVGTLVRPTTKQEYLNRTAPVPSNLFSHSDQQQQWQNASPLQAATTGWCGRVADKVALLNSPSNFPPAVSIAGNSLQLIGQQTRPTTISGSNFGIEGSDHSAHMDARDASLQEMLSFDSGVVLFQAASGVLRGAIEVAKLVDDATRNAPPLATVFPQTTLGQQLSQVARIIQVRSQLGMQRQIFFVSQGGFDTHAGQLGSHAGLLQQLSEAMAAFYNATGELGVAERVVAFTESEFNRTFQPNNGAGTDHAWGGHCLVVGGPVKGGDTYGTFPTLALQGPDDSGSRGNWIPTMSLDQYGATFASWFGVQAIDLPAVFPNINNFPVKNIGFLA